jgi:hypothetical protein
MANVRMSPQFAKDLARILADNVALYEEKIGDITIPKKRIPAFVFEIMRHSRKSVHSKRFSIRYFDD